MRFDTPHSKPAFRRIAAAGVFLVFTALALPAATAQNGNGSASPASLDDWTSHGAYEITEEQRTVERDGEEQSVTDRILTVPELGMEFVWIETLGLWAGRYEVTNVQYRVFEPENATGGLNLDRHNHDFNIDDHPVVSVRMDRRHNPPRNASVPVFIDWLNEREREAERLPEGWRFSLPTGEQWSGLARCDDERRFPWGDFWPPARGNYADETAQEYLPQHVGSTISGYNDGHAHTAPVSESGRNELGLYGVGGNVAEWTLDQDDIGRYATRGGSFAHSSPRMLTVDYRIWLRSDEANHYTGFRLVLIREGQQ